MQAKLEKKVNTICDTSFSSIKNSLYLLISHHFINEISMQIFKNLMLQSVNYDIINETFAHDFEVC